MLRFVVRRVAASFLLLVALSVLMFGLPQLTPGDPVAAYSDLTVPMSQTEVAALRHRLGLDRSLPVQYIAWAGAALRGDLGYSMQHERATVATLLTVRADPTLLLTGTGLILATILGMVFDIIAVVRQGGIIDIALTALFVRTLLPEPVAEPIMSVAA